MTTNLGVRYCGICGHRFADTDRACPACNTVNGRSSVDPQANAVAGRPVSGPPAVAPVRLADLQERIRRALPEAGQTVAESMNRLAARRRVPATTARRARVRGAIVASRLRSAQWRRMYSLLAPRPVAEAPLALRAAWFLVAGIPLTLLWIVAAWAAVCSVVAMPLAARMLDLVPSVLTLRAYRTPAARRGSWLPALLGIAPSPPAQISWGNRAVYFVCIGWWLSLVWLLLGYTLSLTVVGMPLAYDMLRLTPTVANLERR